MKTKYVKQNMHDTKHAKYLLGRFGGMEQRGHGLVCMSLPRHLPCWEQVLDLSCNRASCSQDAGQSVHSDHADHCSSTKQLTHHIGYVTTIRHLCISRAITPTRSLQLWPKEDLRGSYQKEHSINWNILHLKNL